MKKKGLRSGSRESGHGISESVSYYSLTVNISESFSTLCMISVVSKQERDAKLR